MYSDEGPGRNRPTKGTAMSGIETDAGTVAPSSWGELWRKEDYWAIWLGLGTVLVAYALFASGSSIQWLAVTPAKWSTSAQLGAHFADNAPRYLAQFLVWLAIFSVALTALGHKARDFIPAFAFLYALSVAIFALGQKGGFFLPLFPLLVRLRGPILPPRPGGPGEPLQSRAAAGRARARARD